MTTDRPVKSYASLIKLLLLLTTILYLITAKVSNAQATESTPNEQGLQVPVIQILNNVSGYRFFTRYQRLQITIAHFGRDLVTNVEQLPEVGIEFSILLIVPERR